MNTPKVVVNFAEAVTRFEDADIPHLTSALGQLVNYLEGIRGNQQFVLSDEAPVEKWAVLAGDPSIRYAEFNYEFMLSTERRYVFGRPKPIAVTIDESWLEDFPHIDVWLHVMGEHPEIRYGISLMHHAVKYSWTKIEKDRHQTRYYEISGPTAADYAKAFPCPANGVGSGLLLAWVDGVPMLRHPQIPKPSQRNRTPSYIWYWEGRDESWWDIEGPKHGNAFAEMVSHSKSAPAVLFALKTDDSNQTPIAAAINGSLYLSDDAIKERK